MICGNIVKEARISRLPNCLTSPFSTFLFAYSNDLSADVITSSLVPIGNYFQQYQNSFVTLANVRYDLNGLPDQIEFHSDFQSFNASVYSHLPNPIRQLPNWLGSNVEETVIQPFLASKQSLCAAMITLLVKRDNDNDEVDKLIDKLQSKGIIVQAIRSYNVTRGLYTCPVYQLASKTNGVYIYAEEGKFSMVMDALLNYAFHTPPLYATHFQVQGKGTLSLPLITVPFTDGYHNWVDFLISLSDDGSTNNFDYLKFTFTDSTGANDTANFFDLSIFQKTNSIFAESLQKLGGGANKVSLDFNFLNNYKASVDVRIMIFELGTGQTTFLFGYSTQFDPNVVRQVKDQIVQALTANPRTNVKFGDVRFDCNNGSVIYYHDDIASFSASVDAHLPDKSLVFPELAQNETDAYSMLNKFLTNPNIPVYGSTTFFLTKRLMDSDSWTVNNPILIAKRVTTNFIQSNTDGGGNLDSAYLTADYTNGLAVNAGQLWPAADSSFPSVAEKMMGAPYTDNLFYSQSLYSINNVTDQQLDALRVPEYSESLLNVTLVITTDAFQTNFFQSIRLTFVDRATQKNTTLFYDRTDQFSDTDSIWRTIQLKSGSTNDVYIDYRTKVVGSVQIRMYIDKPVPDNWLAPQNIHYNSRPVLKANPKF